MGYPKIGDERFCVEWVSKLAFYEPNSDGSRDIDHDRCEESVEYFSGLHARDRAVRCAERIFPETLNKLGYVAMSHEVFLAYDGSGLGCWETVSDPVYYTGEWESNPEDI